MRLRQAATEQLAERLGADYGLRFLVSAAETDQGTVVSVRVADLEAPNGFEIRTGIRYLTVEATFRADSFAKPLIADLGQADTESRSRACAIAQALENSGASVTIRINGLHVTPGDIQTWPIAPWEHLELSAQEAHVVIDSDASVTLVDRAMSLGYRLMGMVVSLLPVVETETDDSDRISGLPEGAVERIEVNRYERHRLNRAICIEAKGAVCRVCGFSFGGKYGKVGEGFINVHHVTKLSEIGAGYLINPLTDLEPVCANCHAMLHRRDPPYSIEELQSLLCDG